MQHQTAYFRFYEELNDFLPAKKQKTTFAYDFKRNTTVKNSIEAIGIPHTEIDLILVNGYSVGFDYILKDNDRVAVYPVFETLNISPIVRLRPKPLRKNQFVLDVHLGKLARFMRMLGFNTAYQNNYKDHEIISLSINEHRIILTRDRGILKQRAVTHGYWLRSTNPYRQIHEIVRYFDLFSEIKEFTRCLECNGEIKDVDKKIILRQLPQNTVRYYEKFQMCSNCGKIYWEGSHYLKMKKLVDEIKQSQ